MGSECVIRNRSNTAQFKLAKLDDTAITGAGNHTLNPYNATFIKLGSTSADPTLVGISGGADGRVVILYNPNATYGVTIDHDSSNESTAANRIYTMTAADVNISARGSAQFIYDSGASRWILFSVNP